MDFLSCKSPNVITYSLTLRLRKQPVSWPAAALCWKEFPHSQRKNQSPPGRSGVSFRKLPRSKHWSAFAPVHRRNDPLSLQKLYIVPIHRLILLIDSLVAWSIDSLGPILSRFCRFFVQFYPILSKIYGNFTLFSPFYTRFPINSTHFLTFIGQKSIDRCHIFSLFFFAQKAQSFAAASLGFPCSSPVSLS